MANWGRVSDATKHSCISRSKLYEIAARYRGLFRKVDGVTIVDMDLLDRIVAESPPAELAGVALDDTS